MNSFNLRQAVFTTIFILKQKKPIVFVCHNSDNDWQFLGDKPADMADLMIVTLGEIFEYDKSVEEIMTLPEGYQASRDGLGMPWRISQMTEDE